MAEWQHLSPEDPSQLAALAVGLTALTLAVRRRDGRGLPSLGHIGRPDPAYYSMDALRDIPPHCRVFNTDTLGGFVILERPDVQVSLDTRNDLHGRQRVLADVHVVAGKGDIASGLAGAGCVLVPPATGLPEWLRASQGWRLAASDSTAVLFVRAQL
jgi:hypothetical protein